MKREELLAWIGLVLAVPPIVYSVFKEGQWSAGIFVLLVIAALVRGYFGRNKPNFNALSVRKYLEIIDKDGHRACLKATYHLQANHRTQHFTTSYLGGDGHIENIKVDSHEPTQIRPVGNRTEITKYFDRELSPGEEVQVVVSLDQVDTYPRNKESIGHVIEYETEKVEIEVCFPSDRLPRNSEVLMRRQGTLRDGEKCKVNNENRTISVFITHPTRDTEYVLRWEW